MGRKVLDVGLVACHREYASPGVAGCGNGGSTFSTSRFSITAWTRRSGLDSEVVSTGGR
jgi:hypothetical protein